MALNLGTAIGYLLLDTTGFTSNLQRANTSFNVFLSSSQTAQTRLASLGSAFTTSGAALTKGVTLPLVGLGTAAAKSAIDFESAFTGVVKTVDATDEQLAQLKTDIVDMSNKMPQSASQIANVAAAAGQLGIKVEDIKEFTKTMLMLGDATNLSSEEAATQLARLANITGMSSDKYGALGSTIVALGNNFATTEAEIVSMSMRLAAAGTNAGLTETDILALSTAMSSVGIQAEAGGSAMSTFLSNLKVMVETGSDKLEDFASVANMSAEDFAVAFQKDAAGALVAFLSGLQDTERNGASAIAVLDALGIKEIRLRNALLSLSNSHEMLSDSLGLSQQAWDEELALAKEAETRYDTVASKMSILWNNIKNLAISFGEVLMPVIDKAISLFQGLAEKLNGMSDSQKELVVKIATAVAAVGPMLLIFGKLAGALSTVIGLFSGAGGLSAVLTAISGPIGIVIAAIGALAVAWATDFGNIREYTASVFESIKTIFSTYLNIMKTLWSENFLNIKQITQTIWNAIKTIFETALQIIDNSFKIFAALFQGDWETAWNLVKETASTIWEAIKELFMSFLNLIVDTLIKIGVRLLAAAEEAFNNIKEGFSNVWKNIKEWFQGAINDPVETIRSIGEAMYEAGASIFSDLWDGLKSVWDGIVDWVTDAVDWVKSKVRLWRSESSKVGRGGRGGHGGYEGSYASGIDYVPRDMTVKVHQGERIVTAEDNEDDFNNPKKPNSGGDTYNFYSPKPLTPTRAARQMQKAQKQLANGFA